MHWTTQPYWPRYAVEVSTLEGAFADFPHGDHAPVFPRQMDRAIYEETPFGFPVPAVAHEVRATCPRHLTLSFVARRARCTVKEAAPLADSLAILEADEHTARVICRWAAVRGVSATVDYLYPFVLGVAQVEQVSEEDVMTHECEYVPETLAYHPMAEEPEGPDWVERQPPWFQRLLESIRACKTEEALTALGKAFYQIKSLDENQSGVLWSFYHVQKAYILRRQHLSAFARKLKARIEAEKNLPAFGRQLHRIQKGEIEAPALKPHEWRILWAAYHARKAQL